MAAIPVMDQGGIMGIVTPIFKGAAVGAVSFVGMMAFGMVGSLAYPRAGIGAICGALIGLVFWGCIGILASGLYREFVPKDLAKYGVAALLPKPLTAQFGEHGDFTLILTVQEVRNVRVRGLMPWANADMYVEVECGVNPIKRTCVKADGVFNEQFRIQVNSLDDSILLRLKDQDVFGSTDIGYVCLNIENDICKAGFPWQQEFYLEAFENHKLLFNDKKRAALVLSFDHLSDYMSVGKPVKDHDQINKTLAKEWNTYGSLHFLSQTQFNTDAQLHLISEQAHQPHSLP